MRLRNADETASAEKIITSTLQFSSSQMKKGLYSGLPLAKGVPKRSLYPRTHLPVSERDVEKRILRTRGHACAEYEKSVHCHISRSRIYSSIFYAVLTGSR